MVVLPRNPGLERRMAYGNYVRRGTLRNNFQIRSINNNSLNIFNSIDGLTLYQICKNSRVYIKDDLECSICYQDDNTIVRRLKCGHEFHLECIDHWLSKKKSCPICRKSLN
jgi:hypothetical protein